ncbi:hypothetical protein ACFW2Y_34210 [Streptomyces sp. NPDC058877]|uniref:hypothetical protein n=1 Tax=unclassified Streptomyces TaxID=2593676 RepID=UPI0036BC9F1B
MTLAQAATKSSANSFAPSLVYDLGECVQLGGAEDHGGEIKWTEAAFHPVLRPAD